MIAEPLEKGLAEDIENEVVQITWNRYTGVDQRSPGLISGLMEPGSRAFHVGFGCGVSASPGPRPHRRGNPPGSRANLTPRLSSLFSPRAEMNGQACRKDDGLFN